MRLPDPFGRRRVPERQADEKCQDPDGNLDGEWQYRCHCVEQAGSDSADGFAALGPAGHAAIQATVFLLAVLLAQGFIEQGAVAAADKCEGDAEDDFSQQNAAKAVGNRIERPADNAEQ